MTKSIQQIKQELDGIELTVSETAIELRDQYCNYLDLLSQSVKQQLILASYQICTQFYPQSFLNLSLNDKQNLQQTLRQLSIEIKPQLFSIIEQQELEPEPNELNLMAELIKNLPKTKIKSKTQAEKDDRAESAAIDLELIKAELANAEIANIELIEIETSDDLENDEEEEVTKYSTPIPPIKKIEFNNPEHLLLWYKQIERKIKKNLDNTSKKVNKCLQDSKVIPDRVPSKIIDIAVQTEGNKGAKNNSRLPNAPNILHLAIETDQSKKSKIQKNLAQISLLRLRLAEIEFGDPLLNAQRGQIRNLMSKISKLNSKHKDTKHQLAVAEAQAAWRSSWYEG
ncbi:hypothetical protein I4641_05210 [Waterburya agarophytonicola K14]|uniref:Uncharacterized protein n=1 Tax=Waterburya agarophytonicola KI4 TaxID=2874699 RepID=A0A964BMV7_9CYAN|nr:hypothetical protein [Waterburya agarophytonicola]MCC0176374.1 hypothetical protein [Waterburya agarophytonicola KI4]